LAGKDETPILLKVTEKNVSHVRRSASFDSGEPLELPPLVKQDKPQQRVNKASSLEQSAINQDTIQQDTDYKRSNLKTRPSLPEVGAAKYTKSTQYISSHNE
jgi:hypothetical protein